MERNGSPVFYALLERMANTHDKKSHDYASNDDPYGNYHFAGLVSSLFAHSPEDAGFAGRVAEKMYRLANLEGSSKTPSNESIEDTEIDICTIVTLWMAYRMQSRADTERSEGLRLAAELATSDVGQGVPSSFEEQKSLELAFFGMLPNMSTQTLKTCLEYAHATLQFKNTIGSDSMGHKSADPFQR